jgi:hypothetical protein
LRTGQATFGREKHSGLHAFLDQLPHLGHFLLGWWRAFRFAGFVQTEKFHDYHSLLF